MSLNPDAYEPVRLEYYTAKLLTGQDIRGIEKDYSDLEEAYHISILGNGLFYPDEALVHRFEYHDPQHGVSLAGKTRIITVELSKTEGVIEKPVENMSVQELWSIFFHYLTDSGKRAKINEILKHEEGIAMAGEVLIEITQDERKRAWKLSREKYILDTQSMRVSAKREGEKNERIKIAGRMKARGRPLTEIVEDTGLSLEIIENL
jgi:predicted transposase/invertase (TIGR01784 family)